MLMLITFGELTLGFLFLGVDLSILLAALTALVDALPVFGTGTVLLPWALLELLSGRFSMALGLFVRYLIVSLVRSLLEPKLVGCLLYTSIYKELFTLSTGLSTPTHPFFFNSFSTFPPFFPQGSISTSLLF